jgi:hypothetical protein
VVSNDEAMTRQPFGRLWWRIWPTHRYDIHPARKASVFSSANVGSGTDAYHDIAIQLAKSRPFEVAWLLLRRADSHSGQQQIQAYQAYLAARSIFWTKLAVFMAALSLPVALVAALVAG